MTQQMQVFIPHNAMALYYMLNPQNVGLFMQYTKEVEQEIQSLSTSWNVKPEKAVELVELYHAHTPYVWQQCVNQLANFDYEQAQELVSIACVS